MKHRYYFATLALLAFCFAILPITIVCLRLDIYENGIYGCTASSLIIDDNQLKKDFEYLSGVKL